MKYRRRTTTLKGDKRTGITVEITPEQQWEYEHEIGLTMCCLSHRNIFIVITKDELTKDWERV